MDPTALIKAQQLFGVIVILLVLTTLILIDIQFKNAVSIITELITEPDIIKHQLKLHDD